MSLDPCVCTQGLVLCFQIICMGKQKGIHCISHLLCVSIAMDNSICGWFSITFLSLLFPPMQVCEGLPQAPPAYLRCQPGTLSLHGEGRGNKPHGAKHWPSLGFPWIKEGAAKLIKAINTAYDEKGCRWREWTLKWQLVSLLSFSARV